MVKLNLIIFFFAVPLCVLSQEGLSKKEQRGLRKQEKMEKAYEKLLSNVKDSTWVFTSLESNRTPMNSDWGIFSLFKTRYTLDEVFIPNAKNTNDSNRISPYAAKVHQYDYTVDPSTGKINILLIFDHEGIKYQMNIEKKKSDKKSTAEIRKGTYLLITYVGKLD